MEREFQDRKCNDGTALMAQDELGLEGGQATIERDAKAAPDAVTDAGIDATIAAAAVSDAPWRARPAKAAQARLWTPQADDKGSADLVSAAAAALSPARRRRAGQAAARSKAVNPRRFAIVTDASRDAKLTAFGKDTLDDRYLLPGETYQDLFARVADAYADDRTTPSVSMTISRTSGSCPQRRCCRTAAPGAACRSRATSTRSRTASKASSRPGTRTSGSPRAGRHRHVLGQCAASARTSASTARPAASFRSSA
jgi:hypothetical protein